MTPPTLGRPCTRPPAEHNRLLRLGLPPHLAAVLAAPAAAMRRRAERTPPQGGRR